ncbi:MAG TPA: hypothetical protein VMG08_05295 [Allosphingosinicella sp.]|nr:hypothetical protein [Allosphingosinicella sp.]
MRAIVFASGAAALLAGCNEQGRVEDAVRTQLSSAGNVTEVSMTKQPDGGYQGHALVRTADGNVARVNCVMRPGGQGYQGTCGQVIDQALIETTKNSIRQQYQAQGLTVVEVAMAERNADTMAGHAVLRDANGAEQRVNCVAPRDATGGRFGLSCEAAGPATAGAAPAQDAPAEPGTAEEQAPAEEAQ